VVTEPDQGRVVSPSATAAGHPMDGPVQQEEFTVESRLAWATAWAMVTDEKPRINLSVF